MWWQREYMIIIKNDGTGRSCSLMHPRPAPLAGPRLVRWQRHVLHAAPYGQQPSNGGRRFNWQLQQAPQRALRQPVKAASGASSSVCGLAAPLNLMDDSGHCARRTGLRRRQAASLTTHYVPSHPALKPHSGV